MLRLILILVLCCSLFSCKSFIEKYKRSNSGISALDKQGFYDFRHPLPEQSVSIDAATERKVLAALPPSSCPVAKDQSSNKPRIAQTATGSFSYAAESETLYLVTGLPCDPHNRLLVFSGDKLQSSVGSPYDRILKTPDLNRDDKNELLLASQSTRNGETTCEATLVEFDRQNLKQDESFGIVYQDACSIFSGTDEAKKKVLVARGLAPYIEAVQIFYLPRPAKNEMPSFTAERTHAACPSSPGAAPGPWTTVAPK